MTVLVPLLSAFIFVLAVILMRGTILDISKPKENPWPIIWYIQLLLVLLPTALFTLLGIEYISSHSPMKGLVPGTETEIALTTIGTLLLYILALTFFLRVARLRRLTDELPFIQGGERYISRYAWALTIIGSLILATMVLLGFRHAFIYSLLGGERLLSIRLANVYQTGLAKHGIPVLFWISYLLSLLAGLLFRSGGKRAGSLFLIFALLLASAPGNKAPIVNSVLLWILASRVQLPRFLISGWSIVTAIGLGLLTVTLIYNLFLTQYPEAEFDDFLVYLLGRLGLGQMYGVYCTFGLAFTSGLPPGDYYWALVPGASYLNEGYVNYQKMLMMVVQGYDFHQMGVINSYFIAEAFAMGGYTLMYLSPIIVAFSSAVGIKVLNKLFDQLVWPAIAPMLSLPLFLLTHDITGGFNGFPLFKGLFVLVVLLLISLWPLRILPRPCRRALAVTNRLAKK
jgi:hypothetical protein